MVEHRAPLGVWQQARQEGAVVPIWPSSSLDKRQEVDEADWLEHITWTDTSERKSENENERGEESDLPLRPCPDS